jgi:predicted NBD/HSP70 family sugar kinase
MRILVVDVGGSHVKLLATGQSERVKLPSGPTLTPDAMVAAVRAATRDWAYDVVSVGYPGPVRDDRAVREPHNLAPGWVGFDFAAAFERPTRLINDAAMQALGSYEGGRMLFLGLGTGLGSALVIDGIVQPLELAHLPYRRGHTFEEYVGAAALERLGRRRWRRVVADVTERLVVALQADYVVLGGGKVKHLDELPTGARRGANANAFIGGFRLWEPAHGIPGTPVPVTGGGDPVRAG